MLASIFILRGTIDPSGRLTTGPSRAGFAGFRRLMSDSTAPPPAPIPSALSPEEKDLLWYRTIYQGDQQRQLTWRAVVTGGMLGVFLAISNL